MASSRADDQPKSVKDWKFKLIQTGDLMPMVGFGTWQVKGTEKIRNSLDYALEAGFRHIDTAQAYENEEDIGKALKELLPKYNLTRQDIFITSKIRPKNAEIRNEKWEGLVKAKKEGLVKNIGVSNYAVKHLKELLANDHGVKPATNQIYWNPTNQPRDILEFCKKEGILVVAYSSLGSTGDYVNIREDPKIVKIAEKLGKTPSQVLLRWPLQEGIAIIPKASSKNHIVEDIALDFVIPEEDVQTLNSFEQKIAFFDLNNID